MGIHSFFEGVAFGVSEKNEDAINMLLAIIAHKWSEALTIGISFVSAEINTSNAIKYMIFYSFITPIGILLGYFIRYLKDDRLVGIFKAISAGTFIYISCGEIIVEEFAISKNKGIKFLFYSLGIMFIVLVSLIPDND